MPIRKCKKNGKSGYNAGTSTAKCFTGPSGKSKAKRQLRAIKASQARQAKAKGKGNN